jgi:hypothetical protein
MDFSRRRSGGPPGRGGSFFTATSVSYFIDKKRPILDIDNAVRAECGNLRVGGAAAKFTYVRGPEYPVVEFETGVFILRNLEKSGAIEIIKADSRARSK